MDEKDDKDGTLDDKMASAAESLKEGQWDKAVQEKMKKLIDERIVVLRQDYSDEQFDDKADADGKEAKKGAEDVATGQNQSDGT